jgi:hypothetical protein
MRKIKEFFKNCHLLHEYVIYINNNFIYWKENKNSNE